MKEVALDGVECCGGLGLPAVVKTQDLFRKELVLGIRDLGWSRLGTTELHRNRTEPETWARVGLRQ